LACNQIRCAGNDGNCVVTRVNGQVQRLLKHSKPVFGCAWSPFETATIATACGDGNVYVWHIAKPEDSAKPWATLKGHTAKVPTHSQSAFLFTCSSLFTC